jgi:fumarate hydratase class II
MTGTQSNKTALVSCVSRGVGRATALALAARLGVLRRYGAKTQRSLEHFSIGHDLMPREMVPAYAILKKAAAGANRAGGRLDDERHRLIVQSCDEILAGADQNMFPLHVWMTGGGTQFNMNVK